MEALVIQDFKRGQFRILHILVPVHDIFSCAEKLIFPSSGGVYL